MRPHLLYSGGLRVSAVRYDKILTMTMFKDERVSIKHTIPPRPNCMFIQLVGIPVPQDGSGVVMTGDIPIPPCRPLSWKSHPTQIDDYSLCLYFRHYTADLAAGETARVFIFINNCEVNPRRN